MNYHTPHPALVVVPLALFAIAALPAFLAFRVFALGH